MNVSQFTTKSGKQGIIRYFTLDDVAKATDFINTVSHEDTFITFSGEQLVEVEERAYLNDCMVRSDRGDFIKLFCFIDGVLVGDCTVGRNINSRRRGYHVATLGLIIKKEYRGDGVGEHLVRTTIAQAWQSIPGLTKIILWYIDPNVSARKLYDKIGFVECGRIPKGMWYQDNYFDHVLMYLNKL